MLSDAKFEIVQSLQIAVMNWLNIEGTARSTLAGAVVALDTLRVQAPFSEENLFTDGGQLIGGRGAALKATLQRYGEQREFLADGVTTRSTRKFARLAADVGWGALLGDWNDEERELGAKILIDPVMKKIDAYFERRHMTLRPDRQLSPLA